MDSAREDAAVIREAARKAATLTRQLLAFSRREVIQPRVLDLNEVVIDMVKLLHRSLGEDITLSQRLAAKLWQVKVDPGALEQVLLNLAVNARDAMPEGGGLSITTTNRTVSGQGPGQQGEVEPGRYVELVVSDTGGGIPSKVLDHIFEPFFTTKPAGKGTGLGLATVYGIVKQAGGHVEVSTAAEQGTSFSILLPATDERPTTPPAGDRREWQGNGETVLVVDDEPGILAAAARVLNEAGYHVLQAGSGHSALKLAGAHEASLQLLLTDVVMPAMSGVELAQALNPPAVVYMSGYPDEQLANHGVLREGIHFLQKPFNSEKLRRRVREVLDFNK